MKEKMTTSVRENEVAEYQTFGWVVVGARNEFGLVPMSKINDDISAAWRKSFFKK
jgi:hypothetical protein